MKKRGKKKLLKPKWLIIVIIFFAVLLFALIIYRVFTGFVTSSCADSDGGKNYTLKGTVTMGTISLADSCDTSGNLKEVYCASKITLAITNYHCPNGCSNGACITSIYAPSSPPTPEPTSAQNATPSTNITTPTVPTRNITTIKTPPSSILNLQQGQVTPVKSLSPQQAEFSGYIVELSDIPLAVEQSELEQQAAINERSIISRSLGTVLPKQIAPVMSSNLKVKLSDAKNRLITNRENIKINIQNKLGKTSIITGRAVSSENTLQILGEYSLVFNGLVLNITASEAEQVKVIPGIKAVYPNYKVDILLNDSVPLINADDVWKLDAKGNNCTETGLPCLTGKGIRIGIIDTGVDYTHPDLGGCFGTNCKVAGGWDFFNNDNNPIDDMGHGTHCAAIAAGNGVLKGVAPDATIYAYKVLNNYGSGYWDDVIAGIERSIDPNQDGDTSDHLDIISLSLGGYGNPDDAISQAVDNAVSAGIVVVVAAGNSGSSAETIASPGTARKAITVGASYNYPYIGCSDSGTNCTEKSIEYVIYFSSRGPVRWTDSSGRENYLLKPDVVAPGVDVCAAEYDSAWSDKKCIDNNHVSLSGTSMATPHVAGAVALIKQKHPDWTPDEIKMALRSTAKDIDSSTRHYLPLNIETQGYGRVDALAAISNPRPCVAKIETNGDQITGTASCNTGFSSYKLFYIDSYNTFDNEDHSIEIDSSQQQVTNGVLSSFDTSNLNDGKYVLKLEVTDTDGNTYTDYSIFSIKNLYIESIGNHLNYIKGVETVKGRIKFQDYDSFKIQYQSVPDFYYPSKPDTWQDLYENSQKPAGDTLCNIDVSSLADGAYYFRLLVNRGGNSYFGGEIKTVVFHEMLDGWPVEMEGFPKGIPNLGYNGTKAKLIVPYYSACTQSSQSKNSLILSDKANTNSFYNLEFKNFVNATTFTKYTDYKDNSYFVNENTGTMAACWGSLLNLYNPDGTMNVLNNLYDNYGRSYNLPPTPEIPSMYTPNSILLNEEFAFGNSYLQGIFDFDGRPLYNWGLGGNVDTRGNYLSVNAISGETKIFGSFVDNRNNQGTMLIRGLNKTGKNLAGFPINVAKESGQRSLITHPLLVNAIGSKRLALFAGNYDVNGGAVTQLNLFFDVYSMNGSLVKRTKLFESSKEILTGAILYPVAGDMNNDGKTEIIASFYFIDKALYESNRYDSNTYESGVYIIDSDGNIVEKITIFGYWPEKMALANFSGNELRAVIQFNTNSNLYGVGKGEKILSFDSNGNIIFDIGLNFEWDDYKDLIESMVVGDVNSDSEQEIILNYRSRGFGGRHSGYKIFDLNGNLQRDIQIPTLGEVDDYWGYSPILTDFNNDGKLDIIQQSLFLTKEGAYYKYKTRLYAFTLNSKITTNSWPMWMHDPQHTGVYCTSKTCSDLGKTCGSWDDECGNVLDCGTCGGKKCVNGQQCVCKPSGETGCNSDLDCCSGSCSGGVLGMKYPGSVTKCLPLPPGTVMGTGCASCPNYIGPGGKNYESMSGAYRCYVKSTEEARYYRDNSWTPWTSGTGATCSVRGACSKSGCGLFGFFCCSYYWTNTTWQIRPKAA